MADPPILARRVVISGVVQGVGYRAWTADRAVALGLIGWVRNLKDGRVEAVFQGVDGDVRRMIADCASGPALAQVTDVADHAAPVGDWSRFEVWPTK